MAGPCDVVDVAAREYAEGAQDLEKFAKRIASKFGGKVPDDVMQTLFTKAAQRYRADYKGLDAIKTEMAQTIAREIYRTKPWYKKAAQGVGEVANATRALMTSVDLSAPGRQGFYLSAANVLTRPKELGTSLVQMARSLVSERTADAVDAEIQSRPNAQATAAGKKDSAYQKGGLYFAGRGPEALSLQEEAFRSNLAERIPLLGPIIKGSERAYVTFLNKLRADNFDALKRAIEKRGTPATDKELAAIGSFVNAATGRGKLPGALERSAEGLGMLFFAPRNVASRFQLASGEPLVRGFAASPRVGVHIAKTYLQSALGVAGVYGLLTLAGGKTNRDPASSDFGKVKFDDNTYIDPLAGLAQTLTYSYRMGTGKYTNAAGEEQELGAKTFGGTNRLDLTERFLRSKLAPLPGSAVNLMNVKGGVPTDYAGMPTSVKEEIIKNLAPMSLKDVYEAATTEGLTPTDALSLLTFLGVSVSNRQPRPPSGKGMNIPGMRNLMPKVRAPKIKI